MTALIANIDREEKEGKLVSCPVVATDIIYQGALVKNNVAGFLAPCSAEAGASFAGVAYENVDNSTGDAGDLECRVEKEGSFLMSGASFSQSDVGLFAYASDDNTVSTTRGSNEQLVGTITEYVSATSVRVKIDSATAGSLGTTGIAFAGEATSVGGNAAEDFAVVGVLATDVVLVTLQAAGSTPRVIVTAVAATDKITVTFAGDPSTDHVISYLVIR